jgi:hypothetical protein
MTDNTSVNNIAHLPEVAVAHAVPPPPGVSPLQKLGNAVNMFGMAVANEDHRVISATKKHLIDIIHAVYPDHETHSIMQSKNNLVLEAK